MVPLDPDVEERALEQIRRTEPGDHIPSTVCEEVGKIVVHPVFGKGTIIGTPREQSGVIVQFESMVTPRTFGPGAKLQYL